MLDADVVDKFGALMQKLLGLLEKLGQPGAGGRAKFMLSMLADLQRPGPHVSATVLEKMDRLQALLLSFEEGGEQEMSEEARDWCFRQWDVIRPSLLDKKREKVVREQADDQKAASSTDVVCLEDSQGSAEDGSQVAVLSDGSTRPLTTEEQEETAYHEQLEQLAAEQEVKADELRWLEYKAHCLRDEEDAVMRDALDQGEEASSSKRARVMIQVEGEGGRVVRSEVFNLVVREGEALTYKIMVLPRDDPEVQQLRRQQAAREGNETMEQEDEVSDTSADTVPVDARGHALPEPPVLSNEELDKFMATAEGDEYYRKWLKGDLTCAMVRERSGCGLLAKFFGRKVEEEEEQKMLQAALRAEEVAKNKDEGNGKGSRASMNSTEGSVAIKHEDKEAVKGDGLVAPTAWPSFILREGHNAAISLDSQESLEGGDPRVKPIDDVPAAEFTGISAAENAAELAFAIAAGDVPAEVGATQMEDAQAGEDHNAENVANGTCRGGGVGNVAAEGELVAGPGDGEVTGTEQHTASSTEGLVQTDLRSWISG